MAIHDEDGNFITPRRLKIATFCVMFPLILFVLGILGGYLIYGKEQMWNFSTEHFNVVFGVPMAIIASLAVIVILVTATPKDKFSIKLLSAIELTGPSVPIILWMGCFLVIIFGIYAMSGNLKKPDNGSSDVNHATTSEPRTSSDAQR
jgi:hypothetical protein